MAETLKLRLVRCPKCANLLQELPDYSIYQCGGCGTILRARKNGKIEVKRDSERSDEKRIGVTSDKSYNFSDKPENFLGKCEVSGDENAEDNNKVRENDGSSSEIIAQKLRNDSEKRVGKWAVEDDNSGRNQVGIGNMESKLNRSKTLIENVCGLNRSGRFLESKVSEREMEDRFRRMRMDQFERGRFSSSSQFDTDSSNLDSSYRYHQASRSTRTEYLDPDREELLRKLDELKDQLSRVQIVNGKAPEKTTTLNHSYRDHPSSFHRAPSQLSASSNKHFSRPPYFEHYHEPIPRYDDPTSIHSLNHVPMYEDPSSVHGSNHVPRYGDRLEPQMFTRPNPQRIPSHNRYMSLEPDPFEPQSHPYSVGLNQPSCACYQCYALRNRRLSHVASKFMTSHHDEAIEAKDPPVSSSLPQPYTRKASDLKTGARPQRVILAKEDRCYPIAGGTPFVTCQKCFKLLRLPSKKVFYNKGEWKMSCGACSSVICFAIVDGRLVSVCTFASQTTADELGWSTEMGNGKKTSHVKRSYGSFCSEDYSNSMYEFQAMDRARVSSSSCQDVSTSKSEEVQSSDNTTTEDEHFIEEMIARQGINSIVEPNERADFLHENFDYPSKNRAVSRGGKGSLSSRLDQKSVVKEKSTLRGTSLKETLATEMEIPLDDYADADLLQDSGDSNKEYGQQKGKKGVETFLAGIIRKSFKDLSRSNQTTGSGKRNVTVNGHLISDKSVKKAEKLAGPIYPGKYWYDHRAGFWGVMGGPCLGIIPPNIQEFHYPMPEKCAGGNTSVLVNGRELHQKDLDLLSARGLPASRDRSYSLDVNGRVVDKDSGKEIVNLGKLAPTVEKLRCGFGMRAPDTPA